MLVIKNIYSNNISVYPLKNIQAGKIKTAWYLINDTLSKGGVMPKLYILDNESSLELNASMTLKKSSISSSLHTYIRINAAERAVRTWEIISYLVWQVLIKYSLYLNGILSYHKLSLL